MEQDWLIFCTGVVPAISSAVRKLTTAGENVLVQTPVYNIFFTLMYAYDTVHPAVFAAASDSEESEAVSTYSFSLF